MEDNNNLPPLRTPEQITAEELNKYWLDPSKDYPEPHFFFEFNGVGFSPLGGIQAISGQKKNGKTFMLAQLMAVALGSDKKRVKDYLPGLRTRPDTIEWLGHEPRVLYCDTEMEQLNTAKVLRRVHWLINQDMKVPHDRFFVLWLREVPKSEQQSSNKERWRLIKNAIEQKKPDIVFVDGLRDLVDDFNDNAESSEIVGEMMSLASQKNICIWNVLHYNPRPSNDDESKMRGHLGTELGNKVSDTFISTKKKDANTGAVTFTVKQQDARGKDVEDWTFEIVDDAGGLGIPRIFNQQSPLEIKAQQELKEADDYFRQYFWTPSGATYTDLERWLRSKGVTSNRRISSLFDIAMEANIIYKSEKKKYHYNGLSKEIANDKAEDLPFGQTDENDAPF
jgi:archaellum biogenesis ATPase FlaH